jgi:MATE family multidrug resistance protein
MTTSKVDRTDGQQPLSWTNRPLRNLTRLATPIAMSMVSYSVMTLVDTIFVASLGPSALAAVGLGGITAFTVLCFPFGLMGGVRVLVSQAVGAGRTGEPEAYLGAGLIVAFCLGLLAAALGQVAALLMPLAAASQESGLGARDYVSIRLLGAPLVVVFAAMREHRHGLGQTGLPMVATIVANALNVLLDWLFIIELGLGVAGAAWATVLSASSQPLVMLVGGVRGVVRKPTLHHLRALWRMGAPGGLQFLLEVGSFTALAVMIAAYSENDMAAHHIAVQVIHFAFLPIAAVGEAASVLSGQAVGAAEDRSVALVGRSAMILSGAYAALCTVVLAVGSPWIVGCFATTNELGSLAVRLLYVAAAFQLIDAANMVARGTLRGTGDVKYTAYVGIALAWVVTPPLTWLLCFKADLGAFGGWLAITIEIGIGAFLFWRRLWRGSWRAAAARSREMVLA